MAVGLKDTTLTAEEACALISGHGEAFEVVRAKVRSWSQRLDDDNVPFLDRRIVFTGEVGRFYGVPVIAGVPDA